MSPARLLRHRIATLAASIAILACALTASWAVNENETVGFQSNHLFEQGAFGENIDVLNGGLNLSIPIGPKYRVSPYLGYQLQLAYGSKIWDHTVFGDSQKDKLMGRSNMGLGFRLHMGRIYKDIEYNGVSNTCTWYFVTPDGNQHELPVGTESNTCTGELGSSGVTTDTSYLTAGGFAQLNGWNGTAAPLAPLTVTTSDGRITYEFGHFVPIGTLYADAVVDVNDGGYLTNHNRDFGGFYVTRIIDNSATVHPAYVTVDYDTRAGYTHAIWHIEDSLGRRITFTNDCAKTGAVCNSPGVGPTDANRVAVRTTSIAVPAFKASTATENPTSTLATYTFTYSWHTINNNDLNTAWCTDLGNCPQSSTNVLTDIQFPGFSNQSGVQSGYHMRFGYSDCSAIFDPTCDPTGNEGPIALKNGEIRMRQVPTGAVYTYDYGPYFYSTGDTRQLVSKTLYMSPSDMHPDPDPPPNVTHPKGTWSYTREAQLSGTAYTNPKYVTVKDGLGNETVYHYAGSYPQPPPDPPPPSPPPIDYDDGYTPDWDDGVNSRIEYYEGAGGSRRLIRAETRTYDGDINGTTQKKEGRNRRMSRIATIFQDDGGRQSVSEFRDWNQAGLWRETVETGDDVVGAKKTRTQYGTTGDPEIYDYREVTDGFRVLSRSDYLYDPTGRRVLSIDRATLPMSMGTARYLTATDGDSIAVSAYDADNNLVRQDQSDQGAFFSVSVDQNGRGTASVPASPGPKYRILYTWQAGGYLARKEFVSDFTNNTPFSWKAIDRDRDGNTGLIYRVRDTAGQATDYAYDALGRVRDITPPGLEFPTRIQYASDANGYPTKTAVRQGTGGSYDCDATETSDVIMVCSTYDSLGRMIKTQKRQADTNGSAAFQTVDYGIDGRVTFRSEWLAPGQTVVGTTFDYGDPATYGTGVPRSSDPFGRVRLVETADLKRTETLYIGNSSIVTVKGIRREDETTFDATTTYVRDVWNRLTQVLSPDNTAADASYGYDLRDNLIQVELRQPGSNLTQARAFEFDALNRLHVSFNPESGSEVITGYDVLGGVSQRRDASGNLTKTTFDKAARPLTLEWQAYQSPTDPNAPSTPPLLVLQRNTYDEAAAGPYAAGRLTKVQSYDGAGILVATRKLFYEEADLPGRVSKEDVAFAVWPSGTSAPILYDYNNFGFISRIDYPEGPSGGKGAFAVDYAFRNGFATTVRKICKAPETCSPTDIASLTYNPAGGVAMVTTMPGNTLPIATQIQKDQRNRPAAIKIGQWNGTEVVTANYFDSGTYVYDGAGNIAAIGASRYGYDGVNRLVAATDVTDGQTRSQDYVYDAFGNMTRKDSDNPAPEPDGYDLYTVTDQLTGWNANRLLTHQTNGTGELFDYDVRGNVVTAGARVYELDGLNRLTALRPVVGNVATELTRFSYEGGNNRATKEDLVRGLVTFYIRDSGGRLLSEFRRTQQGTYTPEWVQHHIYVGDRLVALRENQLPPPPARLWGATEEIGSPSSEITIYWDANPAGEGSTTAKYKVYRSPNTTPPTWSFRGETTTPSWSESVTTSTWYKYAVTAVDTQNREGYGSDILQYRASNSTPPLVIPGNLKATVSSGRVALTWDANAATGYLGYHVYRGPGGSAVRLTSMPLAHPSFVDLGLTNGQTYTYSVTTVRSTGQESNRSTEVQAIPFDNAPPGPTLGINAYAACNGSSSVTVTWSLAMLPGEATGYRLYRSPWWLAQQSNWKALGYQDSFVDAETDFNTTYAYWVRAVDAQGNLSEESAHVSVKTRALASAVPAPSRPVTQSGDGVVTIGIPPTAAGYGITNVRLYRKPNIELNCNAYELIAIGGPSATVYSLPDGSVTNGVAYDYVLSNVDASGRESAFSRAALATPVGAPWGYRECVEKLGSNMPANWKPGALNCGSLLEGNGTYARLVTRWQAPRGTPYQPMTATNADGPQDYLMGYRIYRQRTPGSLDLNRDDAFFQASIFEAGQHNCVLHPDIDCIDDVQCPSGDACGTRESNLRCSGDTTRVCKVTADCSPSLGECASFGSMFCSNEPARRCDATCTHTSSPDGCSPSIWCTHGANHTCTATPCPGSSGTCTSLLSDEHSGVCEGYPSSGTGHTCTSDDLSEGDTCDRVGPIDGSIATWQRRCLRNSGVCLEERVSQCVTDADCPRTTKCSGGVCACETNSDCSIQEAGCWDHRCFKGYGAPMKMWSCSDDSTCPADTRCVRWEPDPYLVRYQDTGANLPIDWNDEADYGGSCVAAKAVHRVYANGQWIEVESGFSENYDPSMAIWRDRCVDGSSPDVCLVDPSDESDALLMCPDEGADPPSVMPPAVSANGDSITLTWSPPGTCEVNPLPNCTENGECASDKYCLYDGSQYGHCYLKRAAVCSPGGTCAPQGGVAMSCQSRESEIDGYMVYASDRMLTTDMSAARFQRRYHARYPQPIARTDKGTRSYTMSGIAPYLSGSVRSGIGFRIATYDRGGRVSSPSGGSAIAVPAEVGNLPAPASLKNVVWHTYDPLYRADGVKIAWLPGGSYASLRGYRLWRSEQFDGPFCALIPTTNQQTGVRSIACKAASELLSTEVTTSTSDFVDASAVPGQVYVYKVTAVTSAGQESVHSSSVAGSVLPRAASPLSPPTQFKAEAPRGILSYNGSLEYAYIHLNWCRNPLQEGVTDYRVYRSTSPLGSYTTIATLPAACMDGHHRCEILNGQPFQQRNECALGTTGPNCCQSSVVGSNDGGVVGGNCKVVDMTVSPSSSATQTIYYYVVTAVRGTGTSSEEESAFSRENQGRPNYAPEAGYPTWLLRSDIDEFPQQPCGADVSMLVPGLELGPAGSEAEVAAFPASGEWASHDLEEVDTAPYRISGEIVGSTPVAVPRFVFYHLDHLGSPRIMTDESGQILKNASNVEVGRHHYMPFGEEKPYLAQGSTNTRQFTGHERDPEAGLDYMLARYYASSLGRFMAADPGDDTALENPQSWNAYAYVGNNPLLYNDPLGTERRGSVTSLAAVAGIVGSANSVGAEPGMHGARDRVQEGRVLAGVMAAASKTGPADPTNPSQPLFKNKIVKRAFATAWMKTVNGTARGGLAEAGFSIQYKDGKISIANLIDTVHSSGPPNIAAIETDAYTIAIAHTHGNNATQTPSPTDMESKKPNYVASQSGLYVTVPGELRYERLSPFPL